MTIKVTVRTDLFTLERSLDSFARKQLPFATSLALTAIAKRVKDAEDKAIPEIFDAPTPFTQKAVAIIPSRKQTQRAVIFIKDRQAHYLDPYEDGGHQVLNSRALLNPKNIKLNQYGNLSKNTLARLKARPDIFIGPVKTKGGIVNGVWQRIPPKRGVPAHLKLILRFGDGVEVTKHLDFRKRAITVIRGCSRVEMGKAIARALASAKRS